MPNVIPQPELLRPEQRSYRDHWILVNTARAQNLPVSHPGRQYILDQMRKYQSSIARAENRDLFDLLIGDVPDSAASAALIERRDQLLKSVRRTRRQTALMAHRSRSRLRS